MRTREARKQNRRRDGETEREQAALGGGVLWAQSHLVDLASKSSCELTPCNDMSSSLLSIPMCARGPRLTNRSQNSSPCLGASP